MPHKLGRALDEDLLALVADMLDVLVQRCALPPVLPGVFVGSATIITHLKINVGLFRSVLKGLLHL
jgi:hypothetical protein